MALDESSTAPSIPWWLWPNVLAFDAPLVGVVWQRFLGSLFGVTVPLSASVSLVLVIWAIYLTDRWLDAAPHAPVESGDRHRFARRYRMFVGSLAVVVWFVAGGIALLWLPERYLVAGAGVAIVVAVYLVLVHFARRSRFLAGGGKEASVGILFAAGVSVPLVADARELAWTWIFAVAAFAAICWLNCEWITRWERNIADRRSQTGWIVAVVGLVFSLKSPIAVMLTASSAFVVLTAIHLLHGRIGHRLARVLADAALLTPLVWFLL